MASLDSLPADQRAVLQLLLQRGRSYDDIAQLISIDRAGVRDRALAAFDTLGPQTRVASERRGVITDYLLGQLPPAVSQETRERLAESPSERAWARVVASELGALASGSLPDIPVDSPRRDPAKVSSAPSPPDQTSAPGAPDRATPPDSGHDAEPAQARRGCGPLVGLGVLAAVVVAIVIVANSGGASRHNSTSATRAAAATPAAPTTSAASRPTTTSTTPSTAAATAGSTPTAPSGAQLIAQVNLVSATGATGTAGVAQVLKQGASTGVVIVAQGVAANTSRNAYAVWLYNSPADSRILGFVNPGVTTDGRLRTAGPLPTNASHFKQLLVTLETQAKPPGPGKIILKGALSLP